MWIYRKGVGVLNNGATAALLSGESMKKDKRKYRKGKDNSRQSRDC